jgi:hypothetical protein
MAYASGRSQWWIGIAYLVKVSPPRVILLSFATISMGHLFQLVFEMHSTPHSKPILRVRRQLFERVGVVFPFGPRS